MPKLAETQQLFCRLISAPDGVAAGVAALPLDLDAWIRGDERLAAGERLDVYANMYFFRLLECLAEDFPALHAVVGHETFHSLARDYLAAHPSRNPSLRALGRSLADFLEGHALSSEWPFAADLARFEWALLAAFDAADATPLASERLKALHPEQWRLLRLELSPTLRVIEARSPVQDVWAAATEGREIPHPAATRTLLRVWRQDLRVFHRVIDDLELVALRSLERGESFARTCEAAAEVVGDERAAAEVVRLLERWVADDLVVGIAD